MSGPQGGRAGAKDSRKEATFVDVLIAASAVNSNSSLLIFNNTQSNNQNNNNFKNIISSLFSDNSNQISNKITLGNQIINNEKLKNALYNTAAIYFLTGNIKNIANQSVSSLEKDPTIQGISDSYGFTSAEKSTFINGLKTAVTEIVSSDANNINVENISLNQQAIDSTRNQKTDKNLPNVLARQTQANKLQPIIQNLSTKFLNQQPLANQNNISNLNNLINELQKSLTVYVKQNNAIGATQLEDINNTLSEIGNNINNISLNDANNNIKSIQNNIGNISKIINPKNSALAVVDSDNTANVSNVDKIGLMQINNNLPDSNAQNNTMIGSAINQGAALRTNSVPAVLTISNLNNQDISTTPETISSLNTSIVLGKNIGTVQINSIQQNLNELNGNNQENSLQQSVKSQNFSSPTLVGNNTNTNISNVESAYKSNNIASANNVIKTDILSLKDAIDKIIQTSVVASNSKPQTASPKLTTANQNDNMLISSTDTGVLNNDSLDTINSENNQQGNGVKGLINQINNLLNQLNGKIEITNKPEYILTSDSNTKFNNQSQDLQTNSNNSQIAVNAGDIKSNQDADNQINNLIKESIVILPQREVGASTNIKTSLSQDSQLKSNNTANVEYNDENFGNNFGNTVNTVSKQLLGKNEDFKYNIENKTINDINNVVSNIAATSQNTVKTQNPQQIFSDITSFVSDAKKDILIRQIVDNIGDNIQLVPKTEIKMVLKPENLGQLTINIENKNNVIKGTIQVTDSGVKNVLKASIGELKSALNNIGVHTQDIEVTLMNQNGSYGTQSQNTYKEWEGSALVDKTTNNIIENADMEYALGTLNYLA